MSRLTRPQLAFGALVVTQAAHSVEEYIGRLWESFPPARFLSGLVSPDLERGFVIINLSFVAFCLWAFFWPVRRNWPSGRTIAWVLVWLETVNGLGHSLWSLRQGGYTPGMATAPLILVLAFYLAGQLRAGDSSPAARP